jgi:acyl carrier protein
VKPTVPDAISTAIRTVLHDTGREAKDVAPSMLLSSDLGLDSLDLAQTIVLLERSLGVDPFRAPSGARPAIRTVGDLISVYMEAVASAANKS